MSKKYHNFCPLAWASISMDIGRYLDLNFVTAIASLTRFPKNDKHIMIFNIVTVRCQSRNIDQYCDIAATI